MRKRVLLIDSDDDTRAVLATLLTHVGYRVAAAASADQGVKLAGAFRPHAIVTEFLVPARGGRCVIERLRARPGTRAIPTIVFTATAMPEVAARGGGRGRRLPRQAAHTQRPPPRHRQAGGRAEARAGAEPVLEPEGAASEEVIGDWPHASGATSTST